VRRSRSENLLGKATYLKRVRAYQQEEDRKHKPQDEVYYTPSRRPAHPNSTAFEARWFPERYERST
jgi:hypothetical protein